MIGHGRHRPTRWCRARWCRTRDLRPWARHGLRVSLVGLVWLVAACHSPPPQGERLWPEEQTWARTISGAWVHGLVVSEGTSTRSLALASPGLQFRAVAMPIASEGGAGQGPVGPTASSPGDALLEVTLDGRSVLSQRLDEPTLIDLDLGQATNLTLASQGEVILLRPRLVVPGSRGRTSLLVVADTLRADHAIPEHMPRLSRHFVDGLRFERAFSPAAWTLPAVASLFTGQRPPLLRSPDGSLIALPEPTSTLAQGFAERGWATVAVIANETVNHENGFSQGFELFHAPTPKDVADRTRFDARWLVATAERYRRWFEDEDLFLYLQPMDAHDPYLDHTTGIRLPAPRSGDPVDPESLAPLRAAYASEVRFLDEQLGKWLEPRTGFDTVVVTADHGEELFDEGGFRHGPTLVDPVVRVPLWIRGAGIPAAVEESPVSLQALHSFLLSRAGSSEDRTAALAALRAGSEPVTSETFTFGPPRFSVALDERRPIVTARPLEPRPADHPVARWLRATQPEVSLAGEGERSLDSAMAQVLLRRLIEQYRGYRRGVFLAVDPGARLELEVLGAAEDGWYWGGGEVVAERLRSDDSSPLKVSVEAASPFLLIFFPEAENAGAEGVRLLEGDRSVDFDQGLETPGARLWHDEGRPAEVLAGQAVTLERLQALGYL